MHRSGLSLSSAAIARPQQSRSRSGFCPQGDHIADYFRCYLQRKPRQSRFHYRGIREPEQPPIGKSITAGRWGGAGIKVDAKMRNKPLLAALLGGVFALAGPALAQGVSSTNGTVGAIGGENILGTTPADNMPLGAPAVVTDRVVDQDGTVIESRRYVDNNGNVVVNRRALETDAPLVVERYRYYGPRRDHGSSVSGGVGGAIGGEGINGTTPADNAPLPYEWRYR
jgi:hypothetical protein